MQKTPGAFFLSLITAETGGMRIKQRKEASSQPRHAGRNRGRLFGAARGQPSQKSSMDGVSILAIENQEVKIVNGWQQAVDSTVLGQMQLAEVIQLIPRDHDLDPRADGEELSALRLAPKKRTILFSEDPTVFSKVHSIFSGVESLDMVRWNI